MIDNGQELYRLYGWSFLPTDPEQAISERFIVLQSDVNSYFYTTQAVDRIDVRAAFTNLNIDLSNAGFTTMISKDFIHPGNYHIGILFEDRTTQAVSYTISNQSLVRTANSMKLILNDGQP